MMTKPSDGPMAETVRRRDWAPEGLTGVVIAGAGARGAYEAGVLAELLPALFPQGLADVVLIGTSAGAINATLWTRFAAPGMPLSRVGELVCQSWQDNDLRDVYRPLGVTLAKHLLRFDMVGRVLSLLDTTPRDRELARTISAAEIAKHLAEGTVGGLGVVATTCPLDGTAGRSRVFYQGAKLAMPPIEEDGGLDFIETPITHEHVLASSAIPMVFPATFVNTPISEAGWYTDGGVRLNTPIKPAIAFGSRRMVVVSSNATTYPRRTSLPDDQPDVVDLTAQSLSVALADGMIEDLRACRRINALVEQAARNNTELINYGVAPPRPYLSLPIVAVSPQPGAIARMARRVLKRKPSFSGLYARLEAELLRRTYAGLGSGRGNDELLSYLLFDPEFTRQQIELGREDGRAAAAQALREPSRREDGPVVPSSLLASTVQS